MPYFLIFLLSFSGWAYADNLGVHGSVYSITEQDLVQFIESRLRIMQANGEIEKHQKTFQARALASVDRPIPVSAVSRTQKARVFYHDPSITLSKNVTDAHGQTLIPEGTRFNPLSQITLSNTLIFYDGDDPDQVTWAKQTNQSLQGKTLMILVKGSITEQSNTFKRAMYFDQHGKLTQKFGIRHVPAKLSQDALRLRIEEIKL